MKKHSKDKIKSYLKSYERSIFYNVILIEEYIDFIEDSVDAVMNPENHTYELKLIYKEDE
jgi:hypothetical protein